MTITEQENYLGNPETIDNMLRLFSVELSEKKAEGKAAWVKWFMEKLDAIAAALLGEDPEYVIIEGWNKPGGIDRRIREFYAKHGQTAEDKRVAESNDPAGTIKLVLKEFADDIGKIDAQIRTGKSSDEMLALQLQGIYEHYTKLFMGLPVEESPEAVPSPQPESQQPAEMRPGTA